MRKQGIFLTSLLVLLIFNAWGAIPGFKFNRYHTPAEINRALNDVVKNHPKIAKLHLIARTPGQGEVRLLELGSEISQSKKKLPAVLLVANMEGSIPIASEAAVYLIKLILDKPEMLEKHTYYVVACGNPDAANHFFQKPKIMDSRNDKPHNDDMDDQVDEDSNEDLDKNGFITKMRVKDPEGLWIPVPGEPRLMKKADPSKGEKGIYKIYEEGIDNDKDGKYNEDGKGGVNIGINFPHLFKFFTQSGGTWAGSEVETYNLFKFVFSHPEIALTFVFGDTNFCFNPPQGGRKGQADFSKIKIPKRFVKIFNADADKTYTMKEIMEMVQPMVPAGMNLTESMIASFLGLGAVVNPLAPDLKFYKELSEKYKEFLKKNKLDGKRLVPAKAKDGSFELWSYYHLGLPSFSMDFWTLPELKKERCLNSGTDWQDDQ